MLLLNRNTLKSLIKYLIILIIASVYFFIGYAYLNDIISEYTNNDGIIHHNEFLFWVLFFTAIYALSWQTYRTWKRYLTPNKKKSKVYAESIDNDSGQPKQIILEKEDPSATKSNKSAENVKDVNKPNSILDIVSPKND